MRRQLVACRRRETVWIDPDNTGHNAGHQRASVEKGAKTRAIQLVRSSLRRRPNHRRPDTHGDKSAKPRPPAANSQDSCVSARLSEILKFRQLWKLPGSESAERLWCRPSSASVSELKKDRWSSPKSAPTGFCCAPRKLSRLKSTLRSARRNYCCRTQSRW